MSLFSLDLSKSVEYLLDWYKEKNAREELNLNLKERLYWELTWNLEILNELDLLGNEEDENILQLKKSLISKLNFNQFDIISSAGIPMNKIVLGDFDLINLKKYTNYLKNINTNSKLVQKRYHRLRIHQLRFDFNITKNSNSTEYLKFLCQNSKRVLNND